MWDKWISREISKSEHYKSSDQHVRADFKTLRDPNFGWLIVIDEPDTLVAVYYSERFEEIVALCYRRIV